MKYTHLIKAIDSASRQLLGRAAAAVNQALVLRNWLVGTYIVEFEQHGQDRAKYGARLLETLAADLAARGHKGLQIRMLRNCRLFYQVYPQIWQPAVAEFTRLSVPDSIRQPVVAELLAMVAVPSVARTARQVSPPPIPLTELKGVKPLSTQAALRLSWSQLIELIRLDDPLKRAFYENECLIGNWSKRQLQRQIGSLLYERTALSKDKDAVVRRAGRQERQETIEDLIRDPYVLEFTGLAERTEYLESDLEKALLDHLQSFLLELGTGFCFEARQRRITVGNKHDYIDLVFYQRRLRCHVLLDLKIRPFQHGDAGQMNFYLNWWKAQGMESGDNAPIGIILCSDRERTEVEYATAGITNRLFVSRYLTVLPSAEQLRTFLERDRDRVEALMPPPAIGKTQTTKKSSVRTRRKN